MTVTATHSDAATPRNPGNQNLIANISPAMRRKLRLDARLQMFLTGQSLITLGIFGIRTEGVGIALVAGAMALGVACLGLGVFYADKMAIHGELKYRRQHGKWRWER
jgi:hypothetical protein